MFTETELTAAQMQDLASQRPVAGFQSRFADDEPRKGADILVEALEREGVDCVFVPRWRLDGDPPEPDEEQDGRA